MTNAIAWADNDTTPSPERDEAEAAVTDILRLIGVQAGGSVREYAVNRVLVASGIAERQGYDLGWKHCEDSLRD